MALATINDQIVSAIAKYRRDGMLLFAIVFLLILAPFDLAFTAGLPFPVQFWNAFARAASR